MTVTIPVWLLSLFLVGFMVAGAVLALAAFSLSAARALRDSARRLR